jgi:hypothetical protein
MKALFLAVTLVLAGTISAQSKTATPASTTQDQSKDEVRALSGTLKDTHGQLHQQLGAVEKQLATASEGTKEKLTKVQAELTASKAAIEAELGNVNKATAQTWEHVKIKAEKANKEALELLGRVKKESTAVN